MIMSWISFNEKNTLVFIVSIASHSPCLVSEILIMVFSQVSHLTLAILILTDCYIHPVPAGGIFYRYNFHPRQALRANILFGGLRANDLDFKNDFQTARAASFSGTVGELALQFEFNFLPYSTEGKLWDYTPYFAAGAGIAFINTTTFTYVPVIPFSIGFKVNIHKNMGLEAEYGFRKTFYDNFDGLKDLVAPSDYCMDS